MEEKFYVKIKDDFGVVREFEVPTLEMKIAIDNLDKEIKEQYKHDAIRYAVACDIRDKEDYISYKAQQFDDTNLLSFFETQREILKKAIWKVVKAMTNEKYKKILYMRFVGKMKFNKIAEELGCSKQSISDNYKTAIDDLRVLICEDKGFQNTYFFNHWKEHLRIETNIIAKEKLKEFAKIKDFSSITTIDKVIDFVDEVKTIQKKEKKLGLSDKTQKAFKNQKFNFLGKEYSVQDMFDIVGDFLEPFREKQEKNEKSVQIE